MVKLFISNFGRRFLFPAEYDIFMDVGPATDDPNLVDQSACVEGEFRLSVKHVTNE